MKYVPLVLLSLCLAMSCIPEEDNSSQDADTGQDAGTTQDSGTGQDAGTTQDAGTIRDGGSGQDAGTIRDAGTGQDAGTTQDAGTGQDAGTTQDAGTGDSPCGIPYLGDPNVKPDFTPTALGPDGTSSPLTEGSTVSIIEPFQGGRVSFIGVRDVINMDPCGATILGALKDPISRRQVLDSRTINLQRSPDGRGSTTDADDSSFSNVTLCPNQWSSQDIFDQAYELTVILTDRRGKALQKILTVRPACNKPGEDAICRCICKAGYRLGEPCP
ncbi:hypothetical protein [Archangium sp.]|uniref:hypothetical protein n=1 Tax=Archangium sp. TaxID=1872627 RepID=UPI002ED8D32A